MRKLLFTAVLSGFISLLTGQSVSHQLQKAYQSFLNDPQLKHAMSSLYVIDAGTGQVVFDRNSQVGLAPASTQKIITAATAFELLGKDYRYKTQLAYSGNLANGALNGNLLFIGSGDPSLGSWRYAQTKDSVLLNKWWQDIKNAGISRINGSVWFASSNYSVLTIPDGWIWQDIGNYYGAGASVLNWKENQYDLHLKSDDKVGGKVEIKENTGQFTNDLKSAAKGTGDNAYAYYNGVVSGTIPVGEKSFPISIAEIDPISDLCNDFSWYLNSKDIKVESRERFFKNPEGEGIAIGSEDKIISTYYSPSLDSLVYWFLQKSINLYGEALIKTMALQKANYASTDSGVAIVRNFWKQKGIDEGELNISDGSGLSPQNRVTTHVQVEILKYAKKQSWFPYYYAAFPEYNSMKMKSGTIKDVKGYCGYHKAKNGKEYIFSFLVNNYDGTSSALVNKMYKVLDVLK